MLSSYELSTGVENELAKKTFLECIDNALNTSLNKQNLCFDLIFAIFLLKIKKKRKKMKLLKKLKEKNENQVIKIFKEM